MKINKTALISIIPIWFCMAFSVPQETAMKQLFPEADSFTQGKISGQKYFKAMRAGSEIGYGFVASNYAYFEDITAVVGITPDGISKGLVITEMDPEERVKYMTRRGFFKRLENVDIARISLDPKYDKDCDRRCSILYGALSNYDVDSISKATYTVNAVVKDFMDAFYLFDEMSH